MVDFSTYAHENDDICIATNPAYKTKEQRTQQTPYDYELVCMPPGTDSPSTNPVDITYDEVHSFTLSHQPLPTAPVTKTPPTDGNVCMAKEREDEYTYVNIPPSD